MKKVFEIIGIVLAVLIAIYFLLTCFLGKKNTFFNIIELETLSYTKHTEIDTHKGFLGDGEYYTKVSFSNEDVQKIAIDIRENSHWNELPMPENIVQCISNPIDENIIIPSVENGYWLLIDRHPLSTNIY